jgi:sigma-B regulation protein RsbU (phosphoserine phosphatase)
MFVTVFYGICNVKTGEVTYCNAGHNPPYILKANGEVQELPMAKDPMVGAISCIDYHEETLQLEKGDVLMMFTDGVTEAMNVSFDEYGEERLVSILKKSTGNNCQEIINVVRADVSAFTEGAEQSDDITMLTIKRL